MRRRMSDLSTAAMLVLVCASCAPIQVSTPIPPARINHIDQYFGDLASEQGFSGSVLIAQGDEVLLKAGYGMADIENDMPNTPQTIFHLGSVTKQFTAMAVLMLQAQGEIDVEDQACSHIPDCPDQWKEITIHQLLTHTSGLSDAWDFYADKNTRGVSYDLQEMIAWFKDAPLDFEPGDRFSYSSTGYLLLGYLVEQVTGNPFEDFLGQKIFEPLGMMNTRFAREDTDLAVGYSYKSFEAEYINPTLASSAGGLCSTVEDLRRWDRSFYNEELLSRELTDMLFSQYVAAPSLPHVPTYDSVSYGYGWFVGERLGHTVAGHGGTYNGFRALIERYPEEEVSIIVLSNLESSDIAATTFPSQVIFGDAE